MKVFIVHQVYRRDSDTGHDTLWSSKIYRVFKTEEKAEEFIKEKHWWHLPSVTEIEVDE